MYTNSYLMHMTVENSKLNVFIINYNLNNKKSIQFNLLVDYCYIYNVSNLIKIIICEHFVKFLNNYELFII